MKEKKCGGCGTRTTSLKDWFFCRNCGTHYCPACGVNHAAEARKDRQTQKNRRIRAEKGSIENRKEAICPQCRSGGSRYFSPDL